MLRAQLGGTAVCGSKPAPATSVRGGLRPCSRRFSAELQGRAFRRSFKVGVQFRCQCAQPIVGHRQCLGQLLLGIGAVTQHHGGVHAVAIGGHLQDEGIETIAGPVAGVHTGNAGVAHAPYPMKGVGPFTHTNPLDRPPEIFGGKNTLHFGGKFQPYVLLPIIPRKA